MSFSFARRSMRPPISTRDNPLPVAAALTGGRFLAGLAGRLRQPSEKRAAKVVPQLLAAAANGNALAARAIVDRTRFGIAKERAVWASAAAQLSSDMKLAATKLTRSQVALIDHATPESAAASALANVVDVSQLATPTAARSKATKTDREPAAPRKARVSARAPRARAARRPRAPKARKVTRYNPDTGRKVRVDEDSLEAETWPSRKPTRARSRATARAERAVTSAATRLVQRGVAAAGALGLGNVVILGAAGAVAYIVTKKIIEARQEGETLPNYVARARSMAASAFTREMGRPPTRPEYTELRAKVGGIIGDAIRAQSGSLPAMWRNFISLFK